MVPDVNVGVKSKDAVPQTFAVQRYIWNGFAARLPSDAFELKDSGIAPGTKLFWSYRFVKSTPTVACVWRKASGR